jgi:hypothetical protein
LVAGVLTKEKRISEILEEIHELLNSELGQKEEKNADRD